ncbi:19609_t:CDS:2, partial [Racocetra fulgida]
DIYYGSNSNSNRLDVYIPDTSKYPQIFDAAFHPVIVFVYGGSWGSGAHLASLITIRDSIIKSQTMEGRVSSNLNDIDPELELPKITGLIL